MSRYIDADALYELIDGGYDLNFDEVPETKRELLRMIADQPTVDAVPVVRCKECIHRPKMPDNHVNGFDLVFPDYKCPCQCCDDGFYSWYPVDDWFCADGERRAE